MQRGQAELQEFKKDTRYYEAHRDELLRTYPEQWVAIYQECMIGVSPDFADLLEDLKARGFPVGRVLVEHLTEKGDILVLAG